MEADEFCRDLYPRLVGTLRLSYGADVAAEDLAQEALVRVLARWSQVSAMDHPEAWCFRVAFNLAKSRFRRRQSERRATNRLANQPNPPEHSDSADAIAVRDAVAELPRRQRHAIILRFYADLTVDQVAEAMSCKPGTVKAHLHRGIVALRHAGLADVAPPMHPGDPELRTSARDVSDV